MIDEQIRNFAGIDLEELGKEMMPLDKKIVAEPPQLPAKNK